VRNLIIISFLTAFLYGKASAQPAPDTTYFYGSPSILKYENANNLEKFYVQSNGKDVRFTVYVHDKSEQAPEMKQESDLVYLGWGFIKKVDMRQEGIYVVCSEFHPIGEMYSQKVMKIKR